MGITRGRTMSDDEDSTKLTCTLSTYQEEDETKLV